MLCLCICPYDRTKIKVNTLYKFMKTFTTTMRKDDSLFQKYRIRKADNVEMPYPKCGTSMPPPAKNKELCAIEHLERGEYEKCLLVGG